MGGGLKLARMFAAGKYLYPSILVVDEPHHRKKHIKAMTFLQKKTLNHVCTQVCMCVHVSLCVRMHI